MRYFGVPIRGDRVGGQCGWYKLPIFSADKLLGGTPYSMFWKCLPVNNPTHRNEAGGQFNARGDVPEKTSAGFLAAWNADDSYKQNVKILA